MRVNLHTHTRRCHHATESVGEYCREAVAAGIEVLGISDHVPLPDGRWPEVRMGSDELQEYLGEITAARADFPQLRILAAMECEWSPTYENFYREVLLGEHKLDYLIGAAHFIPTAADYSSWISAPLASASNYARYFIKSMESGLFAFMAHPDLFMAKAASFGPEQIACARDILAAAADLKMPLELNAYGIRKGLVESDDGPRPRYPYRGFWELAQEYDITYLINSDAHKASDVWGNYDEARSFIDGLTLREANMSFLWDECD